MLTNGEVRVYAHRAIRGEPILLFIARSDNRAIEQCVEGIREHRMLVEFRLRRSHLKESHDEYD